MSDLDFMNDFSPSSAAETASVGDYEPLPNGWYYGRVTEAQVQNTKAGNGKMVYVRFDVEGPKGANRVIFDRMVVAHSNPTAQEIGRARFGQLCLAAGFAEKPKDTMALIGKTVEAKLKIEKSKDYGDRNAVIAYRKFASGVSATTAPAFEDDIPF